MYLEESWLYVSFLYVCFKYVMVSFERTRGRPLSYVYDYLESSHSIVCDKIEMSYAVIEKRPLSFEHNSKSTTTLGFMAS